MANFIFYMNRFTFNFGDYLSKIKQMYQKYNEFFKEYRRIRIEVEKLSEKLNSKFVGHMFCRSGCDLCCMDYSIFPVEFFSILNDLKTDNPEVNFRQPEYSENSYCRFLNDHLCTIYNYRLLICMTHGLPLLFTNEEGEWELSACDLNFTKFYFSKFTSHNTFPQDKFNSKLFVLNKSFISDFQDIKYTEFDLIPLKELTK